MHADTFYPQNSFTVKNTWNLLRYVTTIILLAVAFGEGCQENSDGVLELKGSVTDADGKMDIIVDWDVVLTAVSTIIIWAQQVLAPPSSLG